jgi:hypothetical protein
MHTTEKWRTKDDAIILQERRHHPAGTISGKYFTVVWRYIQPTVSTVISTRISGVVTIWQECTNVRTPQIERAHKPPCKILFLHLLNIAPLRAN